MNPTALLVFIIVLQVVLLTMLALFVFRFTSIIISRGMDAPFVPTPKKYHAQIAEALNIRDGDVVYDLGCGNGSLLIYCAAHFPNTRFIGVERSHLLFFEAVLRKKFAGDMRNVTFRRENFFTTDHSDATRIYAYLLPRMMEKLYSGDMRKGVRIVSRAFEIPGRVPIEKVRISERAGAHGQHLLYVYEF